MAKRSAYVMEDVPLVLCRGALRMRDHIPPSQAAEARDADFETC